MRATTSTKINKNVQLDVIAKLNPKDRDEVIKALSVIRRLIEEGIAPLDEGVCDPLGRDLISPERTYDPRTVRLRSQL